MKVIAVRLLVVYESVMGNTRAVAEAIADGMRDADGSATVRCVPVHRITAELPDADLAVFGGPTHFLGLPAERTRRIWVRGALRRGRDDGHVVQLEPGAVGPGLREWFGELPAVIDPHDCLIGARDVVAGRRAAVFDTRLDRPLAGGAARQIAQRLRQRGYQLVARPEGFLVESLAGPLRPGEQERARAWGAALVGRLAAARLGVLTR
jgi:hypothetical protein